MSPTLTTPLSNVAGKMMTTLSKSGTTHRRYRTRVHGWLLPPISMIDASLAAVQEMPSDWWHSEVVLVGDLGWVVSQERIDRYGNVG